MTTNYIGSPYLLMKGAKIGVKVHDVNELVPSEVSNFLDAFDIVQHYFEFGITIFYNIDKQNEEGSDSVGRVLNLGSRVACDRLTRDTVLCLEAKLLSKYDQEIPQSQTADKPMAPQRRATQQSRDTKKTN